MLFNYLNIFFEISAHVFRAIGACTVLLPIAGFLAFVALEMCNGLSVILGFMAAIMAAIMAAEVTYLELEQAVEEVRSFRYWRAAVKNM